MSNLEIKERLVNATKAVELFIPVGRDLRFEGLLDEGVVFGVMNRYCDLVRNLSEQITAKEERPLAAALAGDEVDLTKIGLTTERAKLLAGMIQPTKEKIGRDPNYDLTRTPIQEMLQLSKALSDSDLGVNISADGRERFVKLAGVQKDLTLDTPIIENEKQGRSRDEIVAELLADTAREEELRKSYIQQQFEAQSTADINDPFDPLGLEKDK